MFLDLLTLPKRLNLPKKNKISLILLDIELGKTNGLDLCKNFLEINPKTNIIFLTLTLNILLRRGVHEPAVIC